MDDIASNTGLTELTHSERQSVGPPGSLMPVNEALVFAKESVAKLHRLLMVMVTP